MNHKITLSVVVILIASLLLGAADPESFLVALTIRNNTYDTVYVKLEGKTFYYLTVKTYDEEKVFTVKTGLYKATIWGCGSKKVIQKFNISKNLRLTVPACNAKKRANTKKVIRVYFPNRKR
jgi:hypothetical protein